MSDEMIDAKEYKRDPTKAFTMAETRKGLSKIAAKKEAMAVVKKSLEKDQALMRREIDSLMADVKIDNVSVADAMLLKFSARIESRCELYQKWLELEMAKESPSEKRIQWLCEALDNIYIKGLGELRKLNEGDFTMKHGKKSVKLNINADKQSVDEFLKGGANARDDKDTGGDLETE